MDSRANARKDIKENYARSELVSNEIQGFKSESVLMLTSAGLLMFIQLITSGDLLKSNFYLFEPKVIFTIVINS